MFEHLLVELDYPFTAVCQKCSQILFEIRIIDQFARVKISGKSQQQSDTAKFYVLHPELLPSSIIVEKSTYLNQQKPFKMQFLTEIKCSSCKVQIGFKMMTVSSDFHYPEFLNRQFIDIKKVRIRTHKEDVTNQLIERFNQQWQNQTEIDQISFTEQNIKDIKQKQVRQKQGKIQIVKNKQPAENGSSELRILRKQLEQEKQDNRQVINEIVSSIDFFNDVLINLEKRVSQAQSVCNILKQRVQKVVPYLRKQQQK